jgi:hypothetical protein
MDKKCKKALWFFILLIVPVALYAQKDVTQFLDIPVDGYKPELIKKLISKGYTISPYKEDILNGEFNGTDVNIIFGTNNNKVWRIAVSDVNPTDETNIKIRFNNLIQQFANNNRYSQQADSVLAKYTIPKDEDISYQTTVNKKRYEAVFYQKSLKYDSLINESAILIAKDTLNVEGKEKLKHLFSETMEESLNSLNKQVWFMIKEDNGEFRIVIFYDNEYNKANGSSL